IAREAIACRILVDRAVGEPGQAAAIRADPYGAAGVRIYRSNVPKGQPVGNGKGRRNLAVHPMAKSGVSTNPKAPPPISADRENRVIGQSVPAGVGPEVTAVIPHQ